MMLRPMRPNPLMPTFTAIAILRGPLPAEALREGGTNDAEPKGEF
jgi:hypothetical protein